MHSLMLVQAHTLERECFIQREGSLTLIVMKAGVMWECTTYIFNIPISFFISWHGILSPYSYCAASRLPGNRQPFCRAGNDIITDRVLSLCFIPERAKWRFAAQWNIFWQRINYILKRNPMQAKENNWLGQTITTLCSVNYFACFDLIHNKVKQ